MSRSGYTDDCEGSDLVMWRGQVASATRGKRGQQFFRDLVSALDAMPAKRLVAGDLQREDGEVCALGSLGLRRGINLQPLDEGLDEDCSNFAPLASAFDIAEQLAQETMFVNDEGGPWNLAETAEARWLRVRAWASRQIRVREDELLPDPTRDAGDAHLGKKG